VEFRARGFIGCKYPDLPSSQALIWINAHAGPVVEDAASDGGNIRMHDKRARSRHNYAQIWRELELYAMDPRQPVSVAQLSRCIGVPRRTLWSVCHQFSGLSPAAYVREQRMKMAHDMLECAAPAFNTVTEVAASCGFSQLGRFSVRYRELFGHPPSHAFQQAALKFRP
jgi:transcriptional regulator GlxA family with amidase domain